MLYSDILPVQTTLEVCPGCPSTTDSPLSEFLRYGPVPPEPCKGQHPIKERYLAMHPIDRITPQTQIDLMPDCRPGPFNGVYTRVPYNCVWTHAALRYHNHSVCQSGPSRQFRLVGDSHARVLFDGIHHRLSGGDGPVRESVGTSCQKNEK